VWFGGRARTFHGPQSRREWVLYTVAPPAPGISAEIPLLWIRALPGLSGKQ